MSYIIKTIMGLGSMAVFGIGSSLMYKNFRNFPSENTSDEGQNEGQNEIEEEVIHEVRRSRRQRFTIEGPHSASVEEGEFEALVGERVLQDFFAQSRQVLRESPTTRYLRQAGAGEGVMMQYERIPVRTRPGQRPRF